MKSTIVMDSSFIVATIDNNDDLHTDAAYLFKELVERKNSIRVLVSPLIIYEVIVTLHRKGLSSKKIETVLLRFANLDYVAVLSISEMSAFKHAAHALNSTDQA